MKYLGRLLVYLGRGLALQAPLLWCFAAIDSRDGPSETSKIFPEMNFARVMEKPEDGANI